MRRRWKGLLSLWLALLVLLSGQTAWAAEPAYLYIAGQAETLEVGQSIQVEDRVSIGIEIDSSLNEQSGVMDELSGVLSDYDLDGWDIWRVDSGGTYLNEWMADRAASVRISMSDYQSYKEDDGSNESAILLVPQLTEKQAEPLSVTITIGDQSWSAYSFSGSWDHTYSGRQTASISVSPSDGEVVCQYYLAQGSESYAESDLGSLSWVDYGGGIPLTSGEYILYAKAQDADGTVVYASTDGIVIDGSAPIISGITDGGVYEGDTTFTVDADDLESVTVDGREVSLTNNSYTIIADDQTHKIVARDRSGNETVCEIMVNKKSSTGSEIADAGTYTLAVGTAYTLGSGKWTVSGDNTVYEGGRSFYVSTGGEYSFSKQ